MDDQRQYVTLQLAAAATGVPARTLRSWVASGRLPAIASGRSRMVDLTDVRRIAADRGRVTADGNPANEPAAAAAAPPGNSAAMQVTDAARTQLELIRDTLLKEHLLLIERQQERIAELERQHGRLAADHDHLAAERDALQGRVRALEAQRAEWVVPESDEAQTVTRRRWWEFWRA